MAIQHRRGNFADFDPYKMRPGEWAFPLDRGEGYYCISPGDVRRVATKEEIIEILETNQQAYDGLQQLLTELEDETVLTGILADISQLLDDVAINKSNIATNTQDIVNLDDKVNSLLAEKATIKVFDEIPTTSQLKEGEFGFVIDVAQQRYDELNLSFEKLNVNGFPTAFVSSPVGGGVKIVETHLSEIRSTDGTYRSVKVGQLGGTDGSSNYSRLRSAIPIPMDNSRLINKSDLMNFRFSIKPISSGCFDGNGQHFGALEVSFRDSNNSVLGNPITTHFIYDSFVVPPASKDNKVPLDEWSIIKWDLYSHLKETTINFDEVGNIVLTFLAYTNHSTASVEYLIDDISFGV